MILSEYLIFAKSMYKFIRQNWSFQRCHRGHELHKIQNFIMLQNIKQNAYGYLFARGLDKGPCLRLDKNRENSLWWNTRLRMDFWGWTKTRKTPDAFLSLSACCSALLCPYENEFSTASAKHFNSVADAPLRKASGHKPHLLHKLNKQTMRTATYNPELKT